jgi:hypothetical protein
MDDDELELVREALLTQSPAVVAQLCGMPPSTLRDKLLGRGYRCRRESRWVLVSIFDGKEKEEAHAGG